MLTCGALPQHTTPQAVIYLDAQSLFGPGLRQEIAAGLISLLFYTVVVIAAPFPRFSLTLHPTLSPCHASP